LDTASASLEELQGLKPLLPTDINVAAEAATHKTPECNDSQLRLLCASAFALSFALSFASAFALAFALAFASDFGFWL